MPYFYSNRVKYLLEAEAALYKGGDLYPTTLACEFSLIPQQQAHLSSLYVNKT